MKNCLMIYGVRKRLVCTFIRQEFLKYIGCILSAATYGNKGHYLWSETPKTFGKNSTTKAQRDVHGNIYLNRACCDLYSPFTVMLAIELFFLTQLCLFPGCFFKYLPLFIHICLRYILDKV